MTHLLRSCAEPLGIGLAVFVTAGALVLAQAPGRPVNVSDHPVLREFTWRSIGPASMGGRIDDIEAVASNPSIIYVGFATAGVWKSTNMGTTWTPIFDEHPVSSIGDIGLAPSNPDILYVGTGESNNRQSTTSGRGVYKSIDAGKTFMLVGLEDTHHISRIVVDPKDPNIAYVAAMGHLFGPNRERGLFKTIDGGKTWTNTKFIDENTGFTDVVMDPSNSRVLYAASYQRQRTSWGFNGGGPGSGIWKTIDAGKTWTRLEGNGLPVGPFGRIGLAVFAANPKIVYAQIEVGLGAAAPAAAGAPGAQAPEKVDPSRSGVWRSDDGGKTWRVMSNNNNRPMYYSQIRVDPANPEIVYTMGAPFYKSTDGGKTFRPLGGFGHGDHHAMWINPRNGRHLMLGNDGGFNISWDEGETWDFINTMAVGQFYAVGVDMRKPYYVCGGLQDNGSFCGPSATRTPGGITNADWYRVGGGDGFYNLVDPTDYNIVYTESQNGNMSRLNLRTGERANIRPRARPRQQAPGALQPATSNIVPEPPAGEAYRWNWNTPIQISPHDPATIYTGANRFFKSTNRGDTWTASQDLTKQIDRNTLPIMGVAGDQPMLSKHDGIPNYGNITTLAESPSRRDLIWAGTDDGNVQVSRDGGVTWANVAPNIPAPKANYQVSRVEPSRFDAATCYVTIDNHRNDDWNPYVFVTHDYGKTWQSLATGDLRGNVNVIEEDPRNPNLLFLGTEFGLYVSLAGGREWHRFMTGLPPVRIDDLLVHPRDNDLIVGTHGRSIYIVDDITPLQQLTADALKADAFLFDVRPATQWAQDVQHLQVTTGSKRWRGENPLAGAMIGYTVGAGVSGDVKITITDLAGKTVRGLVGTNKSGLNRVRWDLRGDPVPRPAGSPEGLPPLPGQPVAPGTYLVKLAIASRELVKPVIVEEDAWKN